MLRRQLMAENKFDVVGIGNAIVDVLYHSDDKFLEKQNLSKGSMTIIDAERAEDIYAQLDSGTEVSGGSAANTIVCLASLGGSGAFIGKVGQDHLGRSFTADIRKIGVSFETKSNKEGASTARCLIFVTPDAERTMQTYLGACVDLCPDDIDEEVIIGSKITYLEGYLFDPPKAKEAFIKAAKIAKKAGRTVSLSLSDQFCVDRHRVEFTDLINDYVDILFANEDEIKSLYQVRTFDEGVQNVRRHCNIAALTRGSKGSVIVNGDTTSIHAAELTNSVADTTGAGDSYAAGFLYGLILGKKLSVCGRFGSILAGEIISNYGARSHGDLKAILEEKLAEKP